MRPISILALTKSTGGLAFYNRSVLTGLDADRFESHTICLSENGEVYAEELRELDLSAAAEPMARYSLNPASDFSTFSRVLRAARSRDVDVIVCHGSKAGVIGRAVGRLTGKPAVYCQASLPFIRRVQGRKAPIYWALELAARGLGGHMVCLTEGAKRTTVEHRVFPKKKITVIHTGVDTEKFRPRGRRDEVVAEMGLDPGRPVVGWLGRFELQKAPDDFVSVIETVAPEHPDCQFVLAGEGSLKAAAEQRIAAMGLGGRVRLLPWQSDPARTLEGFDIFAMTSGWEGLPITLLEAMASGCAPVVTAVDGCRDVIEHGHSGFIVPAGDPPALAGHVKTLIGDRNHLREVSAAARDRVRTQFEHSAMISAWSSLLEHLAWRPVSAELKGLLT